MKDDSEPSHAENALLRRPCGRRLDPIRNRSA